MKCPLRGHHKVHKHDKTIKLATIRANSDKPLNLDSAKEVIEQLIQYCSVSGSSS